MHGLRWRTAHASSIDEKGLIYLFKATSPPPRAGTTGILIKIDELELHELMNHVHHAPAWSTWRKPRGDGRKKIHRSCYTEVQLTSR